MSTIQELQSLRAELALEREHKSNELKSIKRIHEGELAKAVREAQESTAEEYRAKLELEISTGNYRKLSILSIFFESIFMKVKSRNICF